jgi:hypothetical protein
MALVLLALGGLAAGLVPASQAQIIYPWCAIYTGPNADGAENCSFISYEQCMQTATPGSGAYCTRNPRAPQERRGR